MSTQAPAAATSTESAAAVPPPAAVSEGTTPQRELIVNKPDIHPDLVKEDRPKDFRPFRLRIRNIVLSNISPFDPTGSDPYLVFTLGGNYKEEDLRHRSVFFVDSKCCMADCRQSGLGIVRTGKKGPVFKTDKIKGVPPQGTGLLSPLAASTSSGFNLAHFPESFVKYWRGEYEDLRSQVLKIEVCPFIAPSAVGDLACVPTLLL